MKCRKSCNLKERLSYDTLSDTTPSKRSNGTFSHYQQRLHSTRTLRNAYILLNCDEGRHASKVSDEQLARVLCTSERTVERVKKRFCEEGWEALLQRKPSRRTYEHKVDGEVEAHLVQLCCSEPPEGRTMWTLRLLADKMVELKYVRSLSHVTVREVLKK
jgi:transposase